MQYPNYMSLQDNQHNANTKTNHTNGTSSPTSSPHALVSPPPRNQRHLSQTSDVQPGEDNIYTDYNPANNINNNNKPTYQHYQYQRYDTVIDLHAAGASNSSSSSSSMTPHRGDVEDSPTVHSCTSTSAALMSEPFGAPSPVLPSSYHPFGPPPPHTSLSPSLHPAPDPVIITPSTRYYHLWHGHHTFLCYGHVMLGSNPYLFAATLLLCICCFALYMLCVASQYLIWYNIPIVCGFLVIVTSLVLAACTDPGIVPPLSPPLGVLPLPTASTTTTTTPTPTTTTTTPNSSSTTESPSTDGDAVSMSLDTDIDGTPLKYCPYCHFYRPRRTKHCRYCHVCVEEFDHHCPWIGNCVGRRNYRYYLMFITAITFVAPYVSALCIYMVIEYGHDDAEAVEQHGTTWLSFYHNTTVTHAMALVLAIVHILISGFAFSLSSYHVWLLCHASTTNEEVRGIWRDRDHLYNRGFCGNLNRVCCLDHTPSLLSHISQKVLVNGVDNETERLRQEQERWQQAEVERNTRELRNRQENVSYRKRSRNRPSRDSTSRSATTSSWRKKQGEEQQLIAESDQHA